MGKGTAIKISTEFKEFLRRQKQNSEDFEQIIKRLIKERSTNSIKPVNQLTKPVNQLTKPVNQLTTNREREYNSLPKEIVGVNIKDHSNILPPDKLPKLPDD